MNTPRRNLGWLLVAGGVIAVLYYLRVPDYADLKWWAEVNHDKVLTGLTATLIGTLCILFSGSDKSDKS